MSNPLGIGDLAPWFHAQALDGSARYAFDTVAGRPILLLLMGSGGHEECAAALRLVAANAELFDDRRASFFGVTADPDDVAEGRIAQRLPGIRWFLDYDGAVSRQFGAFDDEGGGRRYRPQWLLLDTMLRVVRVARLADGAEIVAELREMANGEPLDLPTAPVLVVPRVLEPEMCRHLIDQYERNGGVESGFMCEENGLTVERMNHRHKRRADYHVTDEPLIEALRARIRRRLRPMIARAFQFDATRVERWLVACYDADSGGHFRPHRDNTTKGTAHRKFACTINLNADDYEGGDLRFPEFGQRSYRAPTGGAVVFSCSLLHEAQPVTRGKRYAFLPFLYDDDGARIREENRAFLSPEVAANTSRRPKVEA